MKVDAFFLDAEIWVLGVFVEGIGNAGKEFLKLKAI